MMRPAPTPEHLRLEEHQQKQADWKKWGPYLSERQWGTVREDYSEYGNAWDYFTHEQARSRIYRWGEDGILGICDDRQRLCFALSMWNTRDPILKERLFGLTGNQGNHGEDVKEYYFYLDSTPTHSYMKALYKYPQAEFPYQHLVDKSKENDRFAEDYELIDTGIFEGDRYFDVQIEYAKADADDVLIQISITNHGPEAAELSLLPTLWFRNTWTWDTPSLKPTIKAIDNDGPIATLETYHHELGTSWLYCQAPQAPVDPYSEGPYSEGPYSQGPYSEGPRSEEASLLFTENETNKEKLYGRISKSPYVK
ncbi:MAG: glucosidase, partial [Phormidesmis sp.]